MTKFRFSEKQSKVILRQYEKGLSQSVLSHHYKCSVTAIRRAILRLGGKMRTHQEALQLGRIFCLSQAIKIRSWYETGGKVVKLAAKYCCSENAIRGAIKLAGGKIRTTGESQRKHNFKCSRERSMWYEYHLSVHNYWLLWKKQQGLCFWCDAPLPKDLSCVIEHEHDKKKVQGLACSDNICNMFAGFVLKNKKKMDWGLLTPFSDKVLDAPK